jgi:hypothetical protein
LAWIDQIRSWLRNLATRFSPAVLPWPASSSAMNRYPERRIIGMDIDSGVDQVRIIEMSDARNGMPLA